VVLTTGGKEGDWELMGLDILSGSQTLRDPWTDLEPRWTEHGILLENPGEHFFYLIRKR
jgi:hypothetical protein